MDYFCLQQRSMLWGGIAQVQSCVKMTLTFMAYLMSMFLIRKPVYNNISMPCLFVTSFSS